MTYPDRRGGFYYIQHNGTGHRLVSVTTVLSAVAKPALVTWAAKQAARAALQDPSISEEQAVSAVYGQRDSAADRGSMIHSYTEAVDNGLVREPESLPDSVRPYAAAFEKFRVAFRPALILNECVVYNITHGYAGTLDRVYQMGEQVILVDLKTSANYYPEMGLQLVAYKNAEYQLGGEPMPPVDRMMVVLLRDDGTFTAKECDEPFEVFLHYMACWRWANPDRVERMKIAEAKRDAKGNDRVRPGRRPVGRSSGVSAPRKRGVRGTLRGAARGLLAR